MSTRVTTMSWEKIEQVLKHIGSSDIFKKIKDAADASKKKNKFEMVKAGVMIVATVAAVAATIASGFNCLLVLPVCSGCLSVAGIFIQGPQQAESINSQIRRIIKEELADLNFTMLRVDFIGVLRMAESMAMDLNHFLSNLTDTDTTYGGFSENSRFQLDEIYKCMSQLKSGAEGCFSLLAEESTDHKYKSDKMDKHKLIEDSTERKRESHANHCLACLTAYCDLATIYIMLLSQHKILSHVKNLATSLIDCRLKKVLSESRLFLAFLPDRDMLAPIGWWEGKLRVMYAYQRTPKYHTPINRFLSIIELPETSYMTTEANKALDVCLSLAAYTVPRVDPLFSKPFSGNSFFNKSDNHYLCHVNNTRWPVCIFSGLAATKVNKLDFQAEVLAHDTLTRPCANVKDNTHFSSAGIFTVGEGMRSLSRMGDVQYIEFALSNPQYIPASAFRKKIYTNPVDSFSRSTLYKSYRANLQTPYDKAKSFTYHGQFCIVKGELKRGRDHKKGYTLYRFFIEEFDHNKLQQRTMNPFESLMSYDDK